MAEPRAVFDTNVIVSGFLSPYGPPGRIVEWLRQGIVRAVLDDRILGEYRSVLVRPAFRLPPIEIDVVLERIVFFSVSPSIPPNCLQKALPDPDDEPFAECAAAAGCPLVTGNLRHFPTDAISQPIFTPAEFVERVRKIKNEE